ncbi:polyprenyl diphosphate synthase [Streptomyces sp. NPDC052101]|uniref:polyprenyl diphosphate synthase n=1 Tax=Streptomyces sp. NPDC052101 TaxID=3155763 RepID=UPI00343E834E
MHTPVTQRPQPQPRPPDDTVPGHIGVILDGNRRWAQQHQLPLDRAYRQGALRVRDLLSWCEGAGIPVVTVWALSRGNLGRPPQTITPILDAVTTGLDEIAATTKWRIRPIGALDLLPAPQAVRLNALAQHTAGATGGTLNVAIAYDGRADIVAAIQGLLNDRSPETLTDPIDEATLARYLSTSGQPDIDLVIRTSGEQRLSGFMPWQTAHAEFYFCPTPWPDFDQVAFTDALRWFSGRTRRTGL